MARIRFSIALFVLLIGLALSAKLMESDAVHGTNWKLMKSADSSSKLDLVFALKLRNVGQLEETLLKVSNPKSPSYGKLLSSKEIRELVNPSKQSVDKVVEYLKKYQVEDIRVINGFVRAKATVATAEEMLSTKYGSYQSSISGDSAIRCQQYSLPDEIADLVAFVGPTVNFPRPFRAKVETSDPRVVNTPDSLRSLYGVGSTEGGKSDARMAATAFLHQYYLESDLQQFYQSYYPGLYGTPISKVVGVNGNRGGIEASLDVEYMTTLGAGVPTEFWSFPGRQPNNTENEPFLDWLVDLSATENPPLVFSTSYGEDEASVSADYADRMNQEFMSNSARGISFLFASGDSGVGSAFGPCTTYTPQFPADSPYVTAVGATTGVDPEEGAGLSSGGFSNRYARPSWQDAAVATYFATADPATLPDASLYNASGRGFPDVSAQGTGYVVINNNITMPGVAGTSCASPTFGGIVALLNDARIAAGKSPLGFLNPFLYQYPSILNDVTSGNNPGCSTKGFYAAAGWDPITGYGTPNYPQMLDAALALP